MRIWEHKKLIDAFQHNNIPMDKYDWYIDLCYYGGCPHGGFGIGFERLLMWLTMQESVKDCCLYPRYMGRVYP